jgi:hypothetical protein
VPSIPATDAGVVAFLIAGLSFVVVGAIKGYWVPGWIYEQERQQRLKAETQAERATEAVEGVTAVIQKVLDDLASDRRPND